MAVTPGAHPVKITVLGAGAWGTALAIALADRHQVLLWGREDEVMRAVAEQRENKAYLPGFRLPDSLRVSSDFEAAVAHVVGGEHTLLIIASSVSGLRPLAERLKSYPIPNLVWLCKGFEEKTQLLPHQVVHEVLGFDLPIGVLSGPSFAQEVAAGKPCALTVASDSAALRE